MHKFVAPACTELPCMHMTCYSDSACSSQAALFCAHVMWSSTSLKMLCTICCTRGVGQDSLGKSSSAAVVCISSICMKPAKGPRCCLHHVVLHLCAAHGDHFECFKSARSRNDCIGGRNGRYDVFHHSLRQLVGDALQQQQKTFCTYCTSQGI